MKYAEKIHEKFKYQTDCPKCGTPFFPDVEERGKRKLCEACQPVLTDNVVSIDVPQENKTFRERTFKERNCIDCTTVFIPEAPNQKRCDKCQIKKSKGK